MYSPIALFVYNRPDHTKRSIEALSQNELAEKSELFVFSDGPQNESDIKVVSEIRSYLRTVKEIIIYVYPILS